MNLSQCLNRDGTFSRRKFRIQTGTRRSRRLGTKSRHNPKARPCRQVDLAIDATLKEVRDARRTAN
jgi:hypothetical protein